MVVSSTEQTIAMTHDTLLLNETFFVFVSRKNIHKGWIIQLKRVTLTRNFSATKCKDLENWGNY